MKLCKHCGYSASDEAVFCIMCGKKLNNSYGSDGGVINNLKNLLSGKTTEEEIMV